jgi:hypothetical protein
MMQEIGYLGTFIFLLVLLSFLLNIFKVNNKFSDLVTRMRANFSEMFMLDFLGSSIRTISFVSLNPVNDVWQSTSFLVAVIFLIWFIYEFFFQMRMISSLSLKNEENMTKLEKNLYETYFDGLDKETIKIDKFARFYNSIFLLKLSLTQVLIYTLQYTQAIQIVIPLIILMSSLFLTMKSNSKRRIF